MASVTGDYPSAWADYARRRNTVVALLVAYVPATALIGLPLRHVFRTEAPIIVTALLMIVLYVAAGVRLGRWRCPRCGERFHVTRSLANPLARRCLHCGLAKREPDAHP